MEKNDKKQTAVDWLVDGYKYIDWHKKMGLLLKDEADRVLDKIIKKAKEMEMRQIMEAFNAGEHYDGSDGEIKYYNETFDTKEK